MKIKLTTQALRATVRIYEGAGAEQAAVVRTRVERVPGTVGRSATGVQAGGATKVQLHYCSMQYLKGFIIPGRFGGYSDQVSNAFTRNITVELLT